MIKFAFAPLILAMLAAWGSAACAASSSDVQAVSAAGTDFGFRLLHRLTVDKPTGNIFFSPFSVSQALTLTMSGTRGQTQTEMAKTLGLSALPQDKINAANAQLLPELTSDPKVQITVANALWANQGSVFSPVFQADATRFYRAQATTLDFNSPNAAAAINGWVGKNTQGKITQIVTANDLIGSLAVLTDAIYFHGKWQKPFDKTGTKPQPFHLASGGIKTVPLMSQTDTFAYLETPKFQAVSLPYGTGRIVLSVFLPKPGVATDTLTQEMTNHTLNGWLRAMQTSNVQLFLPRFKADNKAKLKEPLSKIGMGLAFSDSANFKPMGLSNAKIGEVLHRATLDVDEQGATATAATAVIMAPRGARPSSPPPPIMRVDHPFLVLIRDTGSGLLLFAGVIRDPE